MAAKNDWKEYFSKSNNAWCWASASRRVTHLGASKKPHKDAIFQAGWVLSSSSSGAKYWNVFTLERTDELPKTAESSIVEDNTGCTKRPRAKDVLTGDAETVQGKMPKTAAGGKQQKVNDMNFQTREEELIAPHYNGLKRRREDRDKGSLARLRALDNWVKNVLITDTLSSRRDQSIVSVLDLACGKGGDFFKIRDACPPGSHLNYVGVDFAKRSLDEFVKRVRENAVGRSQGANTSRIRLCCANLGTDVLHKATCRHPTWDSKTKRWGVGAAYLVEQRFDLLSMQFALHYMCETSARLTRFFQSWSNNLKDGGYFVATTMDADVVRNYVRASGSLNDIVIKDEQGRISCRMQFSEETKESILGQDWDSTLGLRYNMTLTEYDENGVGYNFVEAPEWIVPMASLVHHAKKYGNLHLVQVESCNFHRFYAQRCHAAPYRETLERMKVISSSGENLSTIEWKLANLYRTLVFRKGT